jgi:mutator protein MutT
MATVVGGFLMRDGKLLLGLRAPDRLFAPNCWDSIGGHVEDGETLDQALVRELREEIGVEITDFERVMQTVIDDPEGPIAFTIYRVTAWRGEPSLANPEHTALGWFTLQEASALPNLASDRYREVFHLLQA